MTPIYVINHFDDSQGSYKKRMYIHNDSEFVEVLSKRGVPYDQMDKAIETLKSGKTWYANHGYEFRPVEED